MSELIFVIENSERIKNISDFYITMINNILNDVDKQFTMTLYSNFKIFGSDLIE